MHIDCIPVKSFRACTARECWLLGVIEPRVVAIHVDGSKEQVHLLWAGATGKGNVREEEVRRTAFLHLPSARIDGEKLVNLFLREFHL